VLRALAGVPNVIRSPADALSMTGSSGARSISRYWSSSIRSACSAASSSSILASRAISAISSGEEALRRRLDGELFLLLCFLASAKKSTGILGLILSYLAGNAKSRCLPLGVCMTLRGGVNAMKDVVCNSPPSEARRKRMLGGVKDDWDIS
jgi:hypothetical protein